MTLLPRIITLILLLTGGAACRNISLRVRESRSLHSIVPNNETSAEESRGEFPRPRHVHHHDDHDHLRFETREPEPHEPCGARISLEEHRMMDEAQEVWDEQNRDRTRGLRHGRSLLSVQIDVWFHV